MGIRKVWMISAAIQVAAVSCARGDAQDSFGGDNPGDAGTGVDASGASWEGSSSGAGDSGGSSGSGGSSSGGSSGAGPLGDGGSPCSTPGATRFCCVQGRQTCEGASGSSSWGPCLDGNGQVLTCTDDDGGQDAAGHDAGTVGDLCSSSYLAGPSGMGMFPNESAIFFAYELEPKSQTVVSSNGQIQIWVEDDLPPIISPGEMVDPSTGAVTTPGDRSARAPDGYLWEPALYIAPQTVESGGRPHFPSSIKGSFVGPDWRDAGTAVAPTSIDPPPTFPNVGQEVAEYVWDVAALGLTPGTYLLELVVADGDGDHGVKCITIMVE